MDDPHIFLDDAISDNLRRRVASSAEVPATKVSPPLSDADLKSLASFWDRLTDGTASTMGVARTLRRTLTRPNSSYQYD